MNYMNENLCYTMPSFYALCFPVIGSSDGRHQEGLDAAVCCSL